MQDQTVVDLEAVYAHVKADRPCAALDIIFASFDESFRAGNFAEADTVFTSVDMNRLDSFTLVGLLCASCCAKQYLLSRAVFWDRVYAHLLSVGRDRKDLDRMLDGLR